MTKNIRLFLSLIFISLQGTQASTELIEDKKRILFLGDSITHGGQYVAAFDTWLVKRFPQKRFITLNAGLSSETVSGLSEESHMKHGFARPCVFERLERVLVLTKPDIIFATYGMNCGIYQPLDVERFTRYRHGILRLRAAARQHGAELVHVTPPVFDNHGKPGFNYDSVLTAYSKWLVEQRDQGWNVIDLHSAMHAKLDQEKAKNPEFSVQPDKVHPNKQGHWMMAQALINYFGDSESALLPNPESLLPAGKYKAVQQRMKLRQNAIHAQTKPLRPGVKKVGTLESIIPDVQQLDATIYSAE